MTLYDLPRWLRRAVTFPVTLLATLVALLSAPLLVAAALSVDLVTGPRRLRWSRLLAMGLHYLVLESVAIMAGGVLWAATGFGLATRSPLSQRLHFRVQQRWTSAVLAGVRVWLGARITVTGGELLQPGPIVLAAHHRSFFDAVVPSVVAGTHAPDMPLRHTLKKELLLSPALDLFGYRTRNHFVDRMPQNRTVELAAFRALATKLGSDALVVFPEGTFYSPARLARTLDRLGERDPERARRVGNPRHVLPIRPGGLLAALAAAPTADLVILGHRGFGAFGSFRDIVANTPFREAVHVRLWRVAADDLPPVDDEAARVAALDQHWSAMDAWIGSSQ